MKLEESADDGDPKNLAGRQGRIKMNRTMITAANTLGQLQLKLDMIGNNISNLDTNGYKRSESSFNELLVQQFNNQKSLSQEVGRLTPNGLRQGTGARISQAQYVMTQGAMKKTDRDLDLALAKPDLAFTVSTRDSQGAEVTAYTRNGAFYLSPTEANPERLALVTADGNPVLDEFQEPIIIEGSPTDLSFSSRGTLTAKLDNGITQTVNLGIASVKRPQNLEKLNGSLFALPDGEQGGILENLEGGRRTAIEVKQGTLEGSNVDLSKEMTDMLQSQRLYQFQSRTISMADQMQGLVNGIR